MRFYSNQITGVGGSYVLFPIVLLLDASVACRANTSLRTGHQRLIVGDKVAEGVLACLKLVLESCPCNSVLQVQLLSSSSILVRAYVEMQAHLLLLLT